MEIQLQYVVVGRAAKLYVRMQNVNPSAREETPSGQTLNSKKNDVRFARNKGERDVVWQQDQTILYSMS